MLKSLCFLPILGATSAVLAQTGPSLLLKPFTPGKNVELGGSAMLQAEGESDNGDADFRLATYDVFGRVLLMPDSRARPGFGWNFTMLDIDSDDPALPGQLVDVSVGAGFGLFSLDAWAGGLTIGVGQASADVPSDGDGFYGMASLLVGKQLDKSTFLGFALDYDGNRSIFPDVPLPGFQYRKRLDNRTSVAVGIPFSSIEWKPMERLTLELIYNIPDNFELKVDYGIVDQLGMFAHYRSRVEAFKVDEIPNNRERLLFEQRLAEVGVRYSPVDDINFEVAIGYAFNQEFRVGFDSRDTDKLAGVSDEPFVRIGLDARF